MEGPTESLDMELVRLKSVCKNFNLVRALNNINLTVNQGEILGLVGPNGAGKTTTLRIISALLKPDKGEVYVFEKNTLLYPKEVKKLIGYLPEAPRLYENIKVIDSIKIFARGRELPLSKDFLFSLLKEWELIDISNRPIKTLSKGQKQRVSLLCSLLHNPSLILLDEPFSGLDIESREFIRKKIKVLREEGKTILISSHDLDEVERLADIFAIIANGEIIIKGNIEEIKARLLGNIYRLKISKIPDDLGLISNIVTKYALEDSLSIIFQVQDLEKINEVLKFFIDRNSTIFSLQPLRLEEHLSTFLKTIQ